MRLYGGNMKRIILLVSLLAVVVLGIGYIAGNNDDSNKSDNLITESQNNDTAPESKKVDLSGQQLTTIPDSILNQADITELNLSNNQIATLPAGIAKLTNLEVLNIENNRLESFPDEIAQIKSLKRILANNNRLNSVGSSINIMTWLEYVDISGNNITANEINELKRSLSTTDIKG